MKDILKLVLVLLFGGIGAAIPITGFYLLWSWAMMQIGSTLAYAGLIKVGVTIGLIAVGGSATIGLAILAGVLAGSIAVAIFD